MNSKDGKMGVGRKAKGSRKEKRREEDVIP